MNLLISKSKILVIAPCPFFIDRGTPIRIKRLASWLSERFEIHVATFGQGRDGAFPFRIHRTRKLPFEIKRTGANLAKLLYDFLLLFKVIAVARREQIKVIDGHLHEGALLGILARPFTRAKVIYNSHGTFVPELLATGALKPDSFLVKPLAAFELWIEKRVDRIVAQSIMRRDEFIARGHAPEKVVLVEDVPELDEFYLSDDQIDRQLERQLRPNGEPLLIYSGGMETYQGVDFLFDAFACLCQDRPDVRLVLFGRPLEEYRCKADGLGISSRIVFVDHEPFERLPQYLKICDIGFALRIYGENVPGKLPIYMASGIAVIGTNAKGINTVIRDGETGALVEIGNVLQLVEKITWMLDNPSEIRRIGEAGRTEALRRYSIDDVKRELGTAYRALLGPASCRGAEVFSDDKGILQ